MYEIGRLCVKIAGRDAGMRCVVVDVLDERFVIIDGQTRRRKCNIIHLEPTPKVLKLSKGASHNDVVDALKKEKIEVVEKKSKKLVETKETEATSEKPVSKKKQPVVKEKSAEKKKAVKPKAAKK